jgi:hypothetical protein
MATLLYANQYVTTTLSVVGGIDASQTTDIVIQSVSGVDTTKPGVVLLNYSDPLNETIAEWATFNSINSTTKTLVGVTRGAEKGSGKTHSNGVTVAFPISEAHINRLADALSIGGVATNGVTTTLDEDDFASDSATALATQQSIKAYVDANAGAGGKYVFIIPGTAATGTDVAGTWFAPDAITIDEVDLFADTAGATNATTIDVNLDGTTIFTTQGNRPSLSDTATSDLSNVPDVTSATEGQKITIDIDAVTTTAPTDLYVVIKYS